MNSSQKTILRALGEMHEVKPALWWFSELVTGQRNESGSRYSSITLLDVVKIAIEKKCVSTEKGGTFKLLEMPVDKKKCVKSVSMCSV